MLNNYPVWTMIPAVDSERTAKWYEEKLGLKRQPGPVSDIHILEAGKGTGLVVYGRPKAGEAEHTLASWTVDNVEKVVDELAANGVIFEQYPDLGTDAKGISRGHGGAAAWFKDPEGNILGLFEQPTH